jgi:protoporphyrinogen oxidase
MKRILVVGGGIVGMTAAYFSKKNDNEVTLVDSDDRLGGLLKSDCNELGCFDYGTHVASKTGVEELDDFLFSDFNQNNSYQFNIAKSGNLFAGRLSDISPFVNTHHLPKDVYDQGVKDLLESNNRVGNNLKETLVNRYGNTFYEVIFKGVINKFFGCDAQELANDCLNFFDMNRLLAFDKKATIKQKQDRIMDEKIGFHSESKGIEKAYPKTGGMGQWIKRLERKLVEQGVNIQTQAQITKIKSQDNKFFVTIDSQELEVDELIWTLSSGLLNRFLPTGVAGNKPNFRKTAIYDFVFDRPLNTDSIYINVYDINYLSTRITCYQNLQKEISFYACTVEVLNEENFSFEKMTSQIEQEVLQSGLADKNSQCLFSQCRILKEGFPILKNDNIKALVKMNNYYEHEYKNLMILGRSSAKGFFMSELLVMAYHEIKQ